jgi:hypothetical protein
MDQPSCRTVIDGKLKSCLKGKVRQWTEICEQRNGAGVKAASMSRGALGKVSRFLYKRLEDDYKLCMLSSCLNWRVYAVYIFFHKQFRFEYVHHPLSYIQ